MLRGGDQIRRMLNRHPELELESLADTDAHVFAVYRRRAGPAKRQNSVWRVAMPPLTGHQDE